MSIQPPPRYVVHSVDEPSRRWRRRMYVGLVWLASLVIVGVGVYLATDRGPLASPDHAVKSRLEKENTTLSQQVTTLTRTVQVSQVATQSLKDTLAGRDKTISSLRADLAFYSHLVGGGAKQHGLRVQGVYLAPVGHSRAWNITVTLIHNVKRGQKVTGSLQVSVEGILHGHLTRLPWKKLSGHAQSSGLNFDFRYFQQVRGTLMLPSGFTPNKLRVQANPEHGKSTVHTVNWNDALKPVEDDNHVQQ